jgi:hypothetical protein
MRTSNSKINIEGISLNPSCASLSEASFSDKPLTACEKSSVHETGLHITLETGLFSHGPF